MPDSTIYLRDGLQEKLEVLRVKRGLRSWSATVAALVAEAYAKEMEKSHD